MRVLSANSRTGAEHAQSASRTRGSASHVLPPSRDVTRHTLHFPSAARVKKLQTMVPSLIWATLGSRSSMGPSKRIDGSLHVWPSFLDRTMQMRPPLGQPSFGSEMCSYPP